MVAITIHNFGTPFFDIFMAKVHVGRPKSCLGIIIQSEPEAQIVVQRFAWHLTKKSRGERRNPLVFHNGGDRIC